MKILLVGGCFGKNENRKSRYIERLFLALEYFKPYPFGFNFTYVNGGEYEQLAEVLCLEYDIVFWFPDVDNDKPKLVGDIKRKYPHTMLITSKNNYAAGASSFYSFQQLVAKALESKSNLLVEFTKRLLPKVLVEATIIDPLGNIYTDKEVKMQIVAENLWKRILRLMSFTRAKSVSVGNAIYSPDQPEFFSIIRKHAETFHDLMQSVNKERFFGNASFRCERGFPSFRWGEIIFVSRRNVDKSYISQEGFVATKLNGIKGVVNYYGDIKPSVDTPIQLELYRTYHNVNYMLHSHTYIKNAPFVGYEPIPCGALEEILEVKKRFDWRGNTNFCLNLLGHGSLVLADSPDYFRNILYISRPTPEFAGNYGN